MKMKSVFAKILYSIVALAIVCGSVFVGAPIFAKADDEVTYSATKFFTVGGVDYTADYVVYDGASNDELRFAPIDKVELEEGSYVANGAFKNKVAIDDLKAGVKVGAGVSVELVLITDPYIASGNLDGNEALTEVKNTIKFAEGKVYLNDVEFASYTAGTLFTLETKVASGVLSVIVAGDSATSTNKVECNDRTIATVEVNFNYGATAPVDENGISFTYIDQTASNAEGPHKQEFELNGTSLAKTCGFVIDLDAENTTCKINGKVITMVKNVNYTVKYNSYRLNGGGTPVVKLVVEGATADACAINAEDKKITFVENGTFEFAINDNEKDLAKYTVNVVTADKLYDADKDDIQAVAPKYIDNADAVKSFQIAVNKASKQKYDGIEEELSIRVGASKYLDLPSMESLILDEVNGYGALTPTVYYMNRNVDTSWSTYSGLKVPVKTAGEYVFFVLFTDAYGNVIEAKKDADKAWTYSHAYFYEDNDGTIVINENNPYIFTFEVEDNAPISVTAGSSANWYKGVKNTAPSFTIEASDERVVEYKLYFDAGNNDWKEILPYANDYDDYGYFTAEEIQAIGYDGTLTFTPDRVGTYKITCTVVQTNVVATDSAEVIITVNDVNTVEPYDFWFENNVWSFVFLGIGTLALAGVIVLLCIKPKEDK